MAGSSRRRTLSRRSVLAVPLVVGLGSCIGREDDHPDPDPPAGPETPDPAPETETDQPEPPVVDRLDLNRWETVDLVEAGADPTGETAISEVVESAADDDRLLLLPEGTYTMDRGVVLNSLRNVGLSGNGARIVPTAEYADDVLFTLGASGSVACENVFVGGLEFDFTEDGVGSAPLHSYCDGFAVIEDVSVTGHVDGTTAGRNLELRLSENSDGVGRARIDWVRFPDGGPSAGMWLHGDTDRCLIHATDSVVSNFEDNGFYANTGDGTQIIERCYAQNNSISNFRLGGVIRDSQVVIDDDFTHEPSRPRGIWIRSPSTRVEHCTVTNSGPPEVAVEVREGPCLIDGVTITYHDGDQSSGVRVHDLGGEDVTVKQSLIDAGTIESSPLIDIRNDGTTLEDVTLRGRAVDARAIRVTDASETRFEGLDIDLRGPDSRALWFSEESAAGALVRDSRLQIEGEDHDLRSDMPDVAVESTDGEMWFDTSRNGIRGTINDIGTNDGDPAETGEWHENGRIGVVVEDETNGETHLYTANGWTALE